MYHFIVNPNSRSGLGRSIWLRIEPILKREEIEYSAFFTEYQKHATRIVRELTGDLQEHTIIVLGGDGTINEVINGICDFSKVILGYIPTGSSNDFARGFHLPTDAETALSRILHPENIREMDVGLLTYHLRPASDSRHDFTGNPKSRYFAVSTGLGFDAAICHQAVISRLKVLLNKLKLGKLTYAGIALHRLIYDKPVRMKLAIDHQTPLAFEKVYFAAVMNHRYEGGGFKFCPEALTDDGLLDVIVVSELPKWKILLLLPTAYSGHHVHFRGIHIFRGKHVAIESERALPVHTDGEPVFLQKYLEVSLADKKLRIIT